MTKRKLTRKDYAALNRLQAGTRYPPGPNGRATLTTKRKPGRAKGRSR